MLLEVGTRVLVQDRHNRITFWVEVLNLVDDLNVICQQVDVPQSRIIVHRENDKTEQWFLSGRPYWFHPKSYSDNRNYHLLDKE